MSYSASSGYPLFPVSTLTNSANSFLWSTTTVLINRMLITISSTVEEPQTIKPSRQVTPFGQLETPFELSTTFSGERCEGEEYPFERIGHTSEGVTTPMSAAGTTTY
jgi:hypothetical protein